jgi:hypothetical protein
MKRPAATPRESRFSFLVDGCCFDLAGDVGEKRCGRRFGDILADRRVEECAQRTEWSGVRPLEFEDGIKIKKPTTADSARSGQLLRSLPHYARVSGREIVTIAFAR